MDTFLKQTFDRFYIKKILLKLDINSLIKNNNVNHLFDTIESNIFNNYLKLLLMVLKYYDLKNFDVINFQTIFIVYKHSSIIMPKYDLDNEFNELREMAIIASKNLIHYLIDYDPYDKLCILKLLNKINKYIKYYTLWDDYDKKKLLTILAKTYYNYDLIISKIKNNKKELFLNEMEKIEELEKKKDNIIKNVENVDGVDQFKEILKNQSIVKDSFINIIKDSFNENHLSVLKYELSSSPINIKLLKTILIEIKDVIYSIIPNKIDKLVDLEKNINLDNLDEIDTHYLIHIIDYLFEFMDNFDLSNDIKINKNYKIFKSHIINGTNLEDFIPNSMQFLMKTYYTFLYNKVNTKIN